MSEPITPRRQQARPGTDVAVPGTPTPQKLRQVGATLRRADKEAGGEIKNFVESVATYVQDSTPEERTALKYTLFRHLAEITDDNSNPLDIFCTEEMMARIYEIAGPPVDESEGESEPETDVDLNDEDLPAGEEGRRGRRDQEADSAVNNDDDTLQSTGEQNEHVKAYTDLGWVDGDGSSRERAIIFGSVRRIRPTMKSLAVSTEKNEVEMRELREEFETFLQGLRWVGKRDNRSVWARLHPWSIEIVSELFFVSFVGIGFFQHINNLIIALKSQTEQGTSRMDAIKAQKFVSDNPDLPGSAQKVLTNFSRMTMMNFGNDAYNEYVKMTLEVNMLLGYEELIQAADRVGSTERRYIERRFGRRLKGQGRGIRSEVKDFLVDVMGITIRKFDAVMNRASPAMIFYRRYGEGILVLFKKGMWSTMGKIGIGAFNPIIDKFDELVPEFRETLDVIRQRLVLPLEDETEGGVLQLANVKPQTGMGRRGDISNNWQDRVYRALNIEPEAQEDEQMEDT